MIIIKKNKRNGISFINDGGLYLTKKETWLYLKLDYSNIIG